MIDTTESISAPAPGALDTKQDHSSGRVRLATLSLGHAVVDSYGYSLLAPLFPILKEQLGLSLAEIGAVPLLMGLSASLGQPLMGLATDRWPRIPAVAIGPALAAFFVGLVTLAPNYAVLAGLLLCAGLGIGAYHPQGATLATRAARGSGLAMSAFTVGGNIGFGVAPWLGAHYFIWFGMDRFWLASIPGLLFAAVLGWLVRQPGNGLLSSATAPAASSGRSGNPLALALLTGSVAVRTAVQIGVSTFLAFLLRERMPETSATAAGTALSVFLLANAVAGPIGGHLCDRLGRRAVNIASLAVAPFVFTAALYLPGYWMIAGLALGGFVLMLPHPANVVMAQEYMPASAGMAASMITGLAWALGQFVCWPLGALAEREGLELALLVVSWLPLVGVFLVLPLRDPRAEAPVGYNARHV